MKFEIDWHLSKYNFFTDFPNDNNYSIGVNLFKGCYSLFSKEEIESLNNFKNIKNNELLDKFKNMGFISNFDEEKFIEYKVKITKSYKLINITICPTLNCNFNCPYCFEDHRIGKMNFEIQNKTIELIKKIVQLCKSETLSITWFGGEPLLALDVIDYISSQLISFTEKNKIFYRASIITNGYLLTQDIVDSFRKNKIFEYQITLDGVGNIHNKTRHLSNGEPTYNKIIENLSNIKIPGRITIRHNIYKDNQDEIDKLKEVVENLRKKGNNIVYCPAKIRKLIKKEQPINLLNEKDFSKIKIKDDIKKLSYPCKINYCGAQNLYFITINEKGELFKCWIDVDKSERSFGSIFTWDPNNPIDTCTNLKNYLQYIDMSSIFDDKECKNCIWLPKCMGGCPNRRLFFNKNCISFKNNLEEFTKELVQILI